MHQSLKAIITAIFLVLMWTLVNGLFAKIGNKWKKSKGYKGEGIIIINASDKGEGIIKGYLKWYFDWRTWCADIRMNKGLMFGIKVKLVIHVSPNKFQVFFALLTRSLQVSRIIFQCIIGACDSTRDFRISL